MLGAFSLHKDTQITNQEDELKKCPEMRIWWRVLEGFGFEVQLVAMESKSTG